MKYLGFLLVILLIGCTSNSSKEDKYEPIVTQTNIEMPIEVIEEEPYVQLYGFERFLFVKDSLGPVLEDVKVLTDTYSNEKSAFTQVEKDSAYFIVGSFMGQIRIAPEDDKALYGDDETAGEDINVYYNKYGISIVFDERAGGHLCEINKSYLDNVFYNDLSEELTYYIEYIKFNNNTLVYEMEGLAVSWVELAQVIIKTENYFDLLKGTKYELEVLNHYIWASNILMYGTENESIELYSDSITGLKTEVQEAYNMLIQDPMHNSGNLFSAHLYNMKEVGYVVRGEDMHYMTDEEIKLFLTEH